MVHILKQINLAHPLSHCFFHINFNIILQSKSRDSSVGIALDYGLDVRFPTGAENFSLYNRVQNGSGAHTASYPMGNRSSFPGGKLAGA